jgi:predicted nucleic acid-binding protein
MRGRRFLDSNVVLYLYSEDEPDKKSVAEGLVRGPERAWISTQVLSEMANVLRRKFKLDYPDIAAAVAEVRAACEIQVVTAETVAFALKLREHPDHASSLHLLALPPSCEFRPVLSSQGALNDADFRISLDGWQADSGAPVRGQVERRGASLRIGTKVCLLPEAGWRLLELVRAFARLPAEEKSSARNFREWGRIRALARQAGARLDNFLEKTVVLTPETLKLGLHRVEDGGVAVVELEPTFIRRG